MLWRDRKASTSSFLVKNHNINETKNSYSLKLVSMVRASHSILDRWQSQQCREGNAEEYMRGNATGAKQIDSFSYCSCLNTPVSSRIDGGSLQRCLPPGRACSGGQGKYMALQRDPTPIAIEWKPRSKDE